MRHRELQATSTCREASLFWKGLGHLDMDVCLSSAPACTRQELVSAFKGLLNPQGGKKKEKCISIVLFYLHITPQDNLTDATKMLCPFSYAHVVFQRAEALLLCADGAEENIPCKEQL